MARVLIAEDDRVIANAMATHLRRAGMDVEIAEDGERAMRKLRYERPDVAVVDLMLPGVDGWRITETLRSEGIETPIVIVSARGSEHDKVHALQIGGDDGQEVDVVREVLLDLAGGVLGGGLGFAGHRDVGGRAQELQRHHAVGEQRRDGRGRDQHGEAGADRLHGDVASAAGRSTRRHRSTERRMSTSSPGGNTKRRLTARLACPQ